MAFTIASLANRLFNEHGRSIRSVRFERFGPACLFCGNRRAVAERQSAKSALLHVYRGVGIYLLFNGILGDKKIDGGNILTRPVLSKLPKHDGPKVIYAAGCRLGEASLRVEQITFRQTPYEIKVS